jgi:hypothetical protein
VISLMAGALGADGLALLKARFEEMAAAPVKPKAADQRVICISTRGPVLKDDFEARYKARRCKRR